MLLSILTVKLIVSEPANMVLLAFLAFYGSFSAIMLAPKLFIPLNSAKSSKMVNINDFEI